MIGSSNFFKIMKHKPLVLLSLKDKLLSIIKGRVFTVHLFSTTVLEGTGGGDSFHGIATDFI